MNIQPQSGLGDLLYTLPLLHALSKNENVTVATNHPYVLERLSEHVKISVCPVQFGAGGFPVLNDTFTHLRYDKGGAHYFEKYYTPFTSIPLEESVKAAREIYTRDRTRLVDIPYTVYAPPRAACRHKEKTNFEKFVCSPDPDYADKIIKSYNSPVVIVGNDDVYNNFVMPDNAIDLRDNLNFESLCDIIYYADVVVSQASAITALSGLFAIPTRFLKAASETDESHKNHIASVVWQGQTVL